MLKKKSPACLVWFVIILQGLCSTSVRARSQLHVNKVERATIVSTPYGHISATHINHGANAYFLHNFTLYPNSMFLPVILNSNMLLYVHSGSGRLGWADEGKTRYTDLEEGDVFRVLRGVVFFIHCHPKTVQPLQINAIFANSDYDLREAELGPYTSIQEMVLGVDRKALEATFKASVEVIDQVLGGAKPPAIIRVDDDDQIPIGTGSIRDDNVLQYSIQKVNILKEDKDFENSYGWVTTLTKKKAKALKGSAISFSMVNLTAGSMMEPKWNLMAEEVVVVLEGRGMVRVVCSKLSQRRFCRNKRLVVEEGDVLVVPRLHAKAQMAFDNGPLVLMGFRVSEREEPQFLGGKDSVLRALGNDMVAKTFNVANTTAARLLAAKDESVIFACTSCAEQELQVMMDETKNGGTDTQILEFHFPF